MRECKIVGSASLVTAALFLAACSDGVGPRGSVPQTVSLSIAAGIPGAAAAPESVSVGGHKLVLSKVEVVLREIRLKRVDGSVDCDGEAGSSGDSPMGASGEGGDQGKGHDDDDCERFATGAMVVALPLGGGLTRVLSVPVDTGTYRRVEFKVHKPESSDSAFVRANPDFEKISVRAVGTFDGRPFTFATDVGARQRQRLTPALVVADGTKPTDLTLSVDLGRWFLARSGELIDPATAAENRPNENQVRDNIRRSFRVFCDRNHDGHEDR